MEIGHFLNYLLQYEPSFTVTETCECGSTNSTHHVPLLNIDYLRNKKSFGNILKTLYHKNQKCSGCNSTYKTNIFSGRHFNFDK